MVYSWKQTLKQRYGAFVKTVVEQHSTWNSAQIQVTSGTRDAAWCPATRHEPLTPGPNVMRLVRSGCSQRMHNVVRRQWRTLQRFHEWLQHAFAQLDWAKATGAHPLPPVPELPPPPPAALVAAPTASAAAAGTAAPVPDADWASAWATLAERWPAGVTEALNVVTASMRPQTNADLAALGAREPPLEPIRAALRAKGMGDAQLAALMVALLGACARDLLSLPATARPDVVGHNNPPMNGAAAATPAATSVAPVPKHPLATPTPLPLLPAASSLVASPLPPPPHPPPPSAVPRPGPLSPADAAVAAEAVKALGAKVQRVMPKGATPVLWKPSLLLTMEYPDQYLANMLRLLRHFPEPHEEVGAAAAAAAAVPSARGRDERSNRAGHGRLPRAAVLPSSRDCTTSSSRWASQATSTQAFPSCTWASPR